MFLPDALAVKGTEYDGDLQRASVYGEGRRMQRIGGAIRWLWDHLGTIALVGAWLMSFALPAWAVHATELMGRYQPLSWVAAGFLGMLLSAAVAWIVAQARMMFVSARIRASFYREHDKPNPLDKVFTAQRIRVGDLIPPLMGAVEGRSFIDCDLVGPCIVFLSETGPGALTLKGTEFHGCDAVIIADDATPQNATIFLDCTFSGCRFYSATLLFKLRSVAYVNSIINNLHWVSPTPTALAAEELFDQPPSPQDEG